MAGRRAVVFGGSGFLGREVAAQLAAAGWEVRVASRNPAKLPAPSTARIESVRADIRDEAGVAAALAGCDAVINSVALYVERGADTFEALHVTGARRLAQQARQAGVAQFVQISGINAGRDSPSHYARMRGRGEAAVREEFDGAVVLRPSAIFGPGDSFITFLARVLRKTPLLPLFGAGATRLQPVFAGDVAAAVAAVLDSPAPAPLYELGGPQVYSYKELLKLIARHLGVTRPMFPLPFVLWEVLAFLSRALPGPPLSIDAVRLMKSDNLAGSETAGFADLDIAPVALEDRLPEILPKS